MMQRYADHKAASEQHRAELKETAARVTDRMHDILKQVHEQVEADTNGFRDAPFWDDFFKNTSTASLWGSLGVEHLKEALGSAALRPEHRVLVLEPRAGLGLAARLAEGLRGLGTLDA